MAALTREQLLGTRVRSITTLEVAALGGPVCLRPLTGAEAAVIYKPDGDPVAAGKLAVALSLCDEQGDRLLTAEDADALFDSIPMAAWNQIQDAVLSINGMTKEAVTAARKA